MPRLSSRDLNSAPAPGTERSIPSTTTSTRCLCLSCSANFSIGSVRRAAKITFAFRSARSVANSIPKPLDAPVTNAHLPSISFIQPQGLRRLGPPNAQRGRFNDQHLSRSRSRNLGDVLDATPLGRYQEQRSVIHASEHASEADPVEVDHL